jgi:hypothetical protein
MTSSTTPTRPRRRRGILAGALIAGAAITLSIGGVGYAANGGSFILGKTNQATKVSGLKNPDGTALRLVSPASAPGLRVSSTALVPNFNADRLDGHHASDFAKAGTVVRRSAGTFTPSEGPVNRQARAWCQPGEHAVGGGADVTPLTDDRLGEYFTFVNISSPIDGTGEPTDVAGGQATGWKVEATNTANHLTGSTGRDATLYAFVICAPD